MKEPEELQEIYYKGTRKGMCSYYDKNFVYKMGLNVHPHPDKSAAVCGSGIHLAKSLAALKQLQPKAEEIYECKAGIIYGEDETKVRVGYCWIIRQVVEPVQIKFPENVLCGVEWLKAHYNDHTQQEIDNLGIEVITDRSKTTLKAGMKVGNIRTAMKAVTA